VRLSAQGDFGVPARILADGRFSTPVAFICRPINITTRNLLCAHWSLFAQRKSHDKMIIHPEQ
jgi:hypothetical protein